MLATTVWLGFRSSSSAAVIPGRALTMEEALDPDDLVVGADASVLIDLVEGNRLAGLRELFSAVGVPALVKVEIKRNIAGHPLNKGILAAPWLSRVAAADPEDLLLIADLHSIWGSSPPEIAGEAELIALSLRHGWIALIEDRTARNTAHVEGVHAVRLTTCAVAGAACGVVTADRAWGLHHGFHARRPAHMRLPIGTTPADRAGFDRAIAKTELLITRLGTPAWPGILRHPTLAPGKIDEIVVRTAKGSPRWRRARSAWPASTCAPLPPMPSRGDRVRSRPLRDERGGGDPHQRLRITPGPPPEVRRRAGHPPVPFAVLHVPRSLRTLSRWRRAPPREVGMT